MPAPAEKRRQQFRDPFPAVRVRLDGAAGGSAMVNAWVPILLYFAVAVAFGVVTLLIARVVAPSRYSQVKLDPYECGIEAVGDARDRYSI